MTRKLIIIFLYVLVIAAAGFVFITPAKHDTAAVTAAESSEEGEQRLRDTIDAAVQQAKEEMEESGATLSEESGERLTEEDETSIDSDNSDTSEETTEAEPEPAGPEIVDSADGRYAVTMLEESIPMAARMDANLREGPASSYAQVGAIRTNDEVEVLGTVDTLDGVSIDPVWNEIRTEDGTIAYVRSDLLTE